MKIKLKFGELKNLLDRLFMHTNKNPPIMFYLCLSRYSNWCWLTLKANQIELSLCQPRPLFNYRVSVFQPSSVVRILLAPLNPRSFYFYIFFKLIWILNRSISDIPYIFLHKLVQSNFCIIFDVLMWDVSKPVIFEP